MSTSAIEKVNGYAPEPRFDPVALAEADAIRARSEAETEARLIAARAEAKAVEIKAHEEAEKQRLSNERTAVRNRREIAEQEAKIAEADRKRDEERRAIEAARKAEAEAAEQDAASSEKREQSAKSWRAAALSFAIVCAIVALPVQMSAFWSPKAPWLLIAPLVLEGGAWVVLKGAAAAVDDHRPHWHYRTIAWALAFIAAGINLAHGLSAFDPATAIGTAFASLAGPGVWDLHEHGRIRVRDGKPTRRERRAQRAAERKAAAEKVAAEERAKAEREAKEKAVAYRAEQLAAARADEFPEVWDHAVRLAAALGETTVTDPVWRRAHLDIEGAEPGESVDIIRGRNAAARRIAAARSEAPGGTPQKATKAQRDAQVMPRPAKPRVKPVPPRRKKGDSPKFHPAARSLAADAKRASITASIAAEEQS
ncbi:hypothetical protein QMZ92_16455 [Streptomyces sp. HNM0645]|uniref:hypothetical protein n=1 Tax=Streptomyces sp. HNM0645 TaxID=2782343 RepID=UPI0024B782B2|nr:hypothetical protein [Streptomyces sp. HNM0645]MDI9885927.1 hypothetical protein [Streptomyces sp. HNM0645]